MVEEISMLEDLIRRNRSYRRFDQDHPVTVGQLRELVKLARLSASGANMQPLKYILSSDAKTNNLIFRNTRWAGYLEGWNGPSPGERPSAYIIILGDTEIKESFGCDHGIAAQSMLLGAAEMDLGGCIIGSIDMEDLRTDLNISDQYEILLILALGKPIEVVEIEDVGPDGDIRYWRDDNSVHHVPKRTLDELVIEEFGE
jgi:nitroreductase